MLEAFFTPRSVAVIGASREQGKVGHDVLRNLIQYGFKGRIYPVNPKATEVLGLPCYPSVEAVPGEVDLAIIVVPAAATLTVMEECARKKVAAAIIITAGFRETGREGAERERRLVEIARRAGMRVVGPNCLGIINTHADLNASFAAGMPAKGEIAFFSQSGAFGTAILDWAIGAGIGFSKFISVGNKADVDETTLLQAIGTDAESEVILGYIESVERGGEFMRVAREVSKRKPIVLFKSGGTAAGARAASSHTGALAGSDRAYSAAFKQSGILRAHQVMDLFDWGMAFAFQGRIGGPRVALVTNAGGPGIIATDAIEESSLEMATFTKETIESLRTRLPPTANLYNPIDVIGDAKADRYEAAIRAALADPGVDGLIVILTPQTSTECVPTAEVIAREAARTDKPVLACFMGGPRTDPGARLLMERRVPVYDFPERAVAAMDAMYRQHLWMTSPAGRAERFELDAGAIRAAFASAREAGRLELGEQEARAVIEACGIRLPRTILATDADSAVRAAREIGYPVVMKIASPDILHKSDVGGVKVGVASDDEVVRTFRYIRARVAEAQPRATIRGVLVQEMITGGKEVIIGMMRDPQFGPMLMFGLGGIYVEVLKDVSFRIAPVTRADAEQMIDEIRSIALLRGARGEPPSDIAGVTDALLRLSQLVTDFPEIVEMDVNPLKVFPKGEGVVALDARLTLADV